ncbi:MAG: ABC transporter permease [Thermoleophilia bacterium]|nr:ABC transporter permease [Thermoleophilia bacterium]
MTTLSTAMAEYGRFAPFFRNLVKREVRQKYKGSLFGLIWTMVTPALIVASYWLVFTYVFKAVTIPNYALFLFTGLVVWTFFFGGAQVASSSIVSNANLVKKVRFPREIVPVSAILANGFTAGAMFVIALPLCLIANQGSYLPLVVLPVFVVFLAFLTVGFGLALAGANVYFRDVEHIMAAIGVPWFFITPIFYTFDTLPNPVHGWLSNALYYGNPITPFLSSIREIMFFGGWPGLGDWIYCGVGGVLVLVVGMRLFRRLEREMAVEL